MRVLILMAALAAGQAPADEPCAPLHAALARLYHTPLRHKSTMHPEGDGADGTTEYVQTEDRQYVKFPFADSWSSTPLGDGDRAALDGGLKAMTGPAEGRVCTATGEAALDGAPMHTFLIQDENARSDTRYWVSAKTGLLVKSITALSHGASLTDTYSYDDVRAP